MGRLALRKGPVWRIASFPIFVPRPDFLHLGAPLFAIRDELCAQPCALRNDRWEDTIDGFLRWMLLAVCLAFRKPLGWAHC